MLKLKYWLTITLVFAIMLSSATDHAGRQTKLDATDEIPSITTELIDGTPFQVDSLKGKMILFNFWASYHAKSRMNSYLLVELAQRYKEMDFYKGKGLEVVSISLDRFKAPLQRAIELDGTASFYHICDYLGANSSIMQLFKVSKPMNILVDGEGKIIARDFEVDEISNALQFLARN